MLLETPAVASGQQAPGFALKTPDGETITRASAMGANGLVVAFICNHCPYVKAVADRMAADAKELAADGIGFVAIMSNDYRDYPEDAPPRMTEFAAAHGFGFGYVVDEDQSVGKAYGAVCTPDFFGLNAKGELQYRGRLDSAGMNDPEGRTRDLVDAMRLIGETGSGPDVQHPSMGCSIKWS
ncbi:MAG: thioredoxin family protein [Pseudomonadota bacterium]